MSDEINPKNISPLAASRLLIATHRIRELLARIQEIENDTKISNSDKLSEIKKIKQELAKVSEEIDNIKQEVKLINSYSVN